MTKTNILTEKQNNLIKFAKAIGNPTRLSILIFLSQQETCYFGKIHDELPIAKATVSQHLTELKEAGLIQGEIKGTKVKYCINRENWQIAKDTFNDFFSALKDNIDKCN
jgi:DNA-binding transcriptional ArsR family regulator